jgi:hypothetical protein
MQKIATSRMSIHTTTPVGKAFRAWPHQEPVSKDSPYRAAPNGATGSIIPDGP